MLNIYNFFNRKLNKKGFSLVELSIVLIIVGLIIAGVMGSKSLIENAKVNVLVSEIQTMTTAINNYINDYKPIDATSITPANLVSQDYVVTE